MSKRVSNKHSARRKGTTPARSNVRFGWRRRQAQARAFALEGLRRLSRASQEVSA